MEKFNFKIEKKIPGKLGRAGVIHTPHGDIETPAFIAVGTKATVKAMTPEQVKEAGAQAVLANTYHLYLEPGDEIVRAAGGLHKFMNWSGPVFTDSGGFQVFSLGVAYEEGGISKFLTEKTGENNGRKSNAEKLAKIDDDGVSFKSPKDGSLHRFTPERSMEIQHNLGADIIFAFDECTAPTADYAYQREAMNRTHAWAKRSLDRHNELNLEAGLPNDQYQALFGITQGGRFQDLREESAKTIGAMSFDGFGIGGSFEKKDMNSAVGWVTALLPEDKPRHLLGIGAVEDLFIGVENGADTFDCVMPTREARNGSIYTKRGRINIRNAEFREDFTPIEADCACYTCQHYTRAYVAHLFRAEEMLAATLASIHNEHFFLTLVKNMRQAILADRFVEFKTEFLTGFKKSG
ncbi:MAG: tRNA guanosine(34) transglycosylase Tgt [Candidatus Vogelbacteria bacterium]|nr:tRNA guanosine(34) transglycosylase Tgt [Candidatus Vogelbacteria bacterium]